VFCRNVKLALDGGHSPSGSDSASSAWIADDNSADGGRLLSFRFSGVLSPRKGSFPQSRESAQVTRIGADHLACRPILAVVPPCAGECRLVRVTGVLIFVMAGLVLLLCCAQAGPLNHRRGARLRTGWWALPGSHWRTVATTRQPAVQPLRCHVGNNVPWRTDLC
jgi:hypothetical protein